MEMGMRVGGGWGWALRRGVSKWGGLKDVVWAVPSFPGSAGLEYSDVEFAKAAGLLGYKTALVELHILEKNSFFSFASQILCDTQET